MALPSGFKKAFLTLFSILCPGCGSRKDGFYPVLCPWCRIRVFPDGERSFPGGSALTAFHYSGVPRELVVRLKFGGERKLADPIAALALENWRAVPGSESLVIPVPTTRARLRKRGYNQAALIARKVASKTGASFTGALSRVCGDSQVGLSAAARKQNVKGAFKLADKLPGNADAWIVDDVMTTGATLSECVSILRSAGVRRVTCAVVCFQKPSDEGIIQDKEVDHDEV